MQRELPKVYLSQLNPSPEGSEASEWTVHLEEPHIHLGFLRKDLDGLAPSSNEPWQAFYVGDSGKPVSLTWARTRKEAQEALVMVYVKKQAEVEAHEVQLEIERRHRQRKQALAEMTRDAEPYADLLGYFPCDCPRNEDNVHEPDCMNYWRKQHEPARHDDSALVTRIREALRDPGSLSTLGMAELLDTVRALEKLALGTVKHRPVSMVVEIEGAVQEQLAELRQRVLTLENWQTAIDPSWADVVPAKGES